MAPEPGLQFHRVSAAEAPLTDSEQLRTQLGSLAIAALPEFYGLVPLESEALALAVGDSIGIGGSELEQASAALAGNKPLALVSWVAMDRLDAARRATTVGLMRRIDSARMGEFLKQTAEYSKTVEPIAGSGLYLSRVAVDPACRGRGAGRLAVSEVIDAANGSDVWLHVAKDNDPAIGLYRSLGFEFTGEDGYASRTMRRAGGSK
jgi:ribosomal protein S18 acetylase RimI-like enzyme